MNTEIKLAVPVGPGAQEVTATFPITHLCPFKNEIDNGHMTIKWACDENTLELHALAAVLGAYAEVTISHEDLTAAIADRLNVVRGIELLAVTSAWNTAGATVEVAVRPGGVD